LKILSPFSENQFPVSYDRKDIFLTFDTTGLTQCEDFTIAAPDLARFYSDNQFTVLSANMDFIEAEVNNQRYATCESRPDDNVVQIHRGEGETQISVDGNCIDISVGDDCKILEAIEKLKIHSYLDAQTGSPRRETVFSSGLILTNKL